MREEIRAKCACFSNENCIFAKSVNQQKQERMMENVIETGAQKHMEVTEMSEFSGYFGYHLLRLDGGGRIVYDGCFGYCRQSNV